MVLPLPKPTGFPGAFLVSTVGNPVLAIVPVGEVAFPHRSKILMLPPGPLITLPPAMPSAPTMSAWEGRPGS